MRSVKLHAWSYVAMQFLLLAIVVLVPSSIGPHVLTYVPFGSALVIGGFIGIAISTVFIPNSLTVMPIPKQETTLTTTGVYGLVRHPMYTSVMSIALGSALIGGSLLRYGAAIALIGVLYKKSQFEEEQLVAKFSNYKSYARRVPRFLPAGIFNRKV